MSIYTRKGDKGTTTLRNNESVTKDDVRIEVNGELDELSAALGMVRASLNDDVLKKKVEHLQRLLVSVMAVVAGGELSNESEFAAAVANMEHDIDEMEGKNAVFNFVVPGENMPNAFLHFARTKTRTAERRLWTMNGWYPVPNVIMQFMNRMSDWIFAVTLNIEL